MRVSLRCSTQDAFVVCLPLESFEARMELVHADRRVPEQLRLSADLLERGLARSPVDVDSHERQELGEPAKDGPGHRQWRSSDAESGWIWTTVICVPASSK